MNGVLHAIQDGPPLATSTISFSRWHTLSWGRRVTCFGVLFIFHSSEISIIRSVCARNLIVFQYSILIRVGTIWNKPNSFRQRVLKINGNRAIKRHFPAMERATQYQGGKLVRSERVSHQSRRLNSCIASRTFLFLDLLPLAVKPFSATFLSFVVSSKTTGRFHAYPRSYGT